MSEKSNKCLIFAHRGANNIAPENTMKAFREAIKLKADYIELDVRESKDGYLVIIHDEDVSRITGKAGIISEMTLKELRKLDFGKGEKIPLLEDVIKLTIGKIKLNCEIKTENIGKKVIDMIREAKIVDRTILSSFNHEELLKIQKIDPEIKLASLEEADPQYTNNWEKLKSLIKTAAINRFYSINPFYTYTDKKFIEFSHNSNLKVFVWTVDSKKVIKEMINLGVDGIITNYVQRTKDIMKTIKNDTLK